MKVSRFCSRFNYKIPFLVLELVWQTVAVNLGLNKPEISESYFIHQAGSYQRDGNYTETNPFFSPNLAKYCKGNECSFASWGQHGHVPTSFESAALYYNRYKGKFIVIRKV